MSGADYDEDVPELDAYGKTISRAEKKARKGLAKLGLKPVEGITRVSFKVGNGIFAIAEPEVLKAPTSDTYIVFGEAKTDDMMQRLQQAAAQGLGAAPAAAAADEEDDGEEVSADGLDEDDITSVMEQASVSRNKAIKALNKHTTVVDAILDLAQ